MFYPAAAQASTSPPAPIRILLLYSVPIALPHTAIERAIDFAILSTTAQSFLSAEPLPRGPAFLTYRCSDASKPRAGSGASGRTHGTGTLWAIPVNKAPAKEQYVGWQRPRVLALGPAQHGACNSTCETLLKSEENLLFRSLKTSKTQDN